MRTWDDMPQWIKAWIEKAMEPDLNTQGSRFYMIPKIHKPQLGWRPIVPASGTPNACLAQLVDYFLQPLIQGKPSFLKDTGQLVSELEDLHIPHHGKLFMFTADVESLYPSIPLKDAIYEATMELGQLPVYYYDILQRVLHFVAENNIIQFRGRQFIQVTGVATGSPIAPSLANLFMARLEQPVLDDFNAHLCYYKRYIDDIFGIFIGEERDFHTFRTRLSGMHPAIKLTWNVSHQMAEFLDLSIQVDSRRQVSFSTHQKILNNYLYIPWKSYHPRASKLALIKGELTRYLRNSSSIEAFLETKKRFASRLLARGYPLKVILKQFDNLTWKDRTRIMDRIRTRRPPSLQAIPAPTTVPLVIKLPYDVTMSKVNWGRVLNPKPILDCRTLPSFRRRPNLLSVLRRHLLRPVQGPLEQGQDQPQQPTH